MTVLFNKAVMVPANFSAIDFKVLSINFSDSEDAQSLKFTWKIVSFSEN